MEFPGDQREAAFKSIEQATVIEPTAMWQVEVPAMIANRDVIGLPSQGRSRPITSAPITPENTNKNTVANIQLQTEWKCSLKFPFEGHPKWDKINVCQPCAFEILFYFILFFCNFCNKSDLCVFAPI